MGQQWFTCIKAEADCRNKHLWTTWHIPEKASNVINTVCVWLGVMAGVRNQPTPPYVTEKSEISVLKGKKKTKKWLSSQSCDTKVKRLSAVL